MHFQVVSSGDLSFDSGKIGITPLVINIFDCVAIGLCRGSLAVSKRIDIGRSELPGGYFVLEQDICLGIRSAGIVSLLSKLRLSRTYPFISGTRK
jgi:hypothetical protein